MNNLASAFAAAALLLGPALAAAQDADISQQREVYRQINDNIGRMDKVSANASGESGPVSLTAWRENGQVRKITATPGISGAGFDEFYLENGRSVFVFSTIKKDDGKSIEERIYLADGEIVKWLSTDKTFVAHNEDYDSMARRIANDTANFAGALGGRPSDDPETGASIAEGTFAGVEQGDYAHWKLRAADGTERSFFILQTDAAIDRVLADPQEYEGRACRVRWERRNENIPEAGGPMEIDVLLGVDWL